MRLDASFVSVFRPFFVPLSAKNNKRENGNTSSPLSKQYIFFRIYLFSFLFCACQIQIIAMYLFYKLKDAQHTISIFNEDNSLNHLLFMKFEFQERPQG